MFLIVFLDAELVLIENLTVEVLGTFLSDGKSDSLKFVILFYLRNNVLK